MPTLEKYNRNQEIVRLAKEGKDYTYIGSKFNISKQSVSVIARRYGVSCAKNEPLEPISDKSKRGIKAVVFPNLKKYLQEHEISVKMFCEMIGVDSNTGSSMCRFLYGKTRKVSIDAIKDILDITEMEFCEAFSLE